MSKVPFITKLKVVELKIVESNHLLHKPKLDNNNIKSVLFKYAIKYEHEYVHGFSLLLSSQDLITFVQNSHSQIPPKIC